MLDDYTSVLRHAGVLAAARMWVRAPGAPETSGSMPRSRRWPSTWPAGTGGDDETLLAAVDEHQPDATVVDVRMPPDMLGAASGAGVAGIGYLNDIASLFGEQGIGSIHPPEV
ncbi:MAG: hypothetical protein ABSA53_34490 [Streptosporangiaceae bacterium]